MLSLEMSSSKRSKQQIMDEMDMQVEFSQAAATAAVVVSRKLRQDRGPNERRSSTWWEQGYRQWNNSAFKRRLRVSRETFDFILTQIENDIIKQPTRMNPHPTPPTTQLAICLYRLAHRCSFLTLGDLFGVAPSTAHNFFQDVSTIMVRRMYDQFVCLPRTTEEWTEELKGFLENWEFPCVGAWDGFHVYISTTEKKYYSFKKRYSVSNMGFIGHNKRFLWAGVGAPGSTHDSWLLRNCDIYAQIEDGVILPNKKLNLSPYGEIPFATVGDSAFPCRPGY